MDTPSHFLFVSVEEQTLSHIHAKCELTFSISTAKKGTGQQNGSFQTPLGLHRIAEKIGGDEPIGTVFKGRKPIRVDSEDDTSPGIKHRILWLEGMEPGFNQGGDVDTKSRYIYIHGVGDESFLGTPHSEGCVNVGKRDLLPLFDRVSVGTLVYI